MKSTCIATVAIIGSSSAATHRIRTSIMNERSLQGSLSLAMSVPVSAVTTGMSAPVPELISFEPEMSLSSPFVEPETLPADLPAAETPVLYESLSIPAIWEEFYGSTSMSFSMGWTPEDEGLVPAEGGGYTDPNAVPTTPVEPTTDVPTTPGEEPAAPGDRAPSTSGAGAVVVGFASAVCIAGAIGLF